ncbi:MAG: 50S ribosomal protein L10, partial [Clostridiales bacterium]|nr:50S ribosomal protein L10 [Clostridiales bacterium]
FKGPTRVAFSDNLVAPAKILCKAAEELEPLEVKGGIIEGKVASKDEVIALSKVPDKETLYSQVVFGLLFPLTKLAMLVKAVAEKASEGAPAEAAAPAEEAAAEAPAEEAAAEEAPAEVPAPAEAPAE